MTINMLSRFRTHASHLLTEGVGDPQDPSLDHLPSDGPTLYELMPDEESRRELLAFQFQGKMLYPAGLIRL